MNRGKHSAADWRQLAQPFNDQYREYDAWFADNPVFALEVAAIKDLATTMMPPQLEIGVGPGRFAQLLGTGFGIDPAPAPLALAQARGVQVCRAIGEQLPFRTGVLGTIYLLFSFCFLVSPETVLRECRRALTPEGHLVIGLVPAKSAWGQALIDKGAKGHAIYRWANFRTITETLALLAGGGFSLVESRSSLFSAPHSGRVQPDQRPGLDERAGFAVLVASPCRPATKAKRTHQE